MRAAQSGVRAQMLVSLHLLRSMSAASSVRAHSPEGNSIKNFGTCPPDEDTRDRLTNRSAAAIWLHATTDKILYKLRVSSAPGEPSHYMHRQRSDREGALYVKALVGKPARSCSEPYRSAHMKG